MAKVSVIIPTYNRPQYLYRALKSVELQDYTGEIEAVIVNDCGQDVSQIVAPFKFARLIDHQENKGLAASRNTGVSVAMGDYIAYLDDDDIWLPRHVSTVMEYLTTLVHVRAAYSDPYHWIKEQMFVKARTVNQYGKNIACIINLIHERSAFGEIGGFDESLREMEDWDYIIRMSRHLGGMWHIVECTTVYSKRYAADQLSNDREKMRSAFEIVKERHGLDTQWQEPFA